MSAWIAVTERMPEPTQKVLFWSADWPDNALPGYGQPASYSDGIWFDDSYCDRDGDPRECCNVTHWMPLPPPPTGQLKE